MEKASDHDPWADAGASVRNGGTPEARATQLPAQLQVKPVLDVAQLEESAMGSAVFGRRLMAIFLQRMDELLLEIVEAVSSSNTEALRGAAHRLKGAAAAMGAVRVRTVAEWLEGEAERGDVSAAREVLPQMGALQAEVSGALKRHYAGRDE